MRRVLRLPSAHRALWDQLELRLAGQIRLLHDLCTADIGRPLLSDLALLVQPAKAPVIIACLCRDDAQVRDVVPFAD